MCCLINGSRFSASPTSARYSGRRIAVSLPKLSSLRVLWLAPRKTGKRAVSILSNKGE